ncbi:MAG: lytic transglycosylase domain-containing protein [Steroidobacteraceae bacterium]
MTHRNHKRARRRRLIEWVRWARGRWRTFQRTPLRVKVIVGAAFIVVLWLAVNWIYQVTRKPSELFFPVSATLNKTPAETWRQYSPIFRKYATSVMTPDLLAAIAQVEGSGNPVARTYWRWVWTSQPFEMYRPASSAVGMYQITDGTFAEARRYCIHDHAVAEDGPWNSWHSCWFNSLYARVLPSDAVELTAAYLDHHVALILERRRIGAATLQHKQMLAAMIHLCGAGAGDEYAKRGFRLPAGQRCGDHEVREYLDRVGAMMAVFKRLQGYVSAR